MRYFNTFPNRTLCDVLNEMRKCHETRNYSPMLGLIEEAQSMGNRMESGLSDKNDVQDGRDQLKKIKQELAELEEKKDEAELSKNNSKI